MLAFDAKKIRFEISDRIGAVSGLLMKPKGATAFLVFAHGAGAGMRHVFMETVSAKLADRGVGTLRYQFPYIEKNTKRPDSAAVLMSTVRAAVSEAQKYARDLPVFAGGKSMGGRMTSLAAAEKALESVVGLVFFGFPLHAAGKPSADRGEHLMKIKEPLLFLQGTRDTLADLTLLKPLRARIGNRAEIFEIAGGDHSFHVLKSSGRSDDQVLDDVADKVSSWMKTAV
jgi:predicted alpha/beta-hydrolase family hydrolase